jgi:hypothetical protein
MVNFVERGEAISAVGFELLASQAAGVPVPPYRTIAEMAGVDRRDVGTYIAQLPEHYPEFFPEVGDVRAAELETNFGHLGDWQNGIKELHFHFRDSKTLQIGREMPASAVGGEFLADDETIGRWVHLQARAVRGLRRDVSAAGFDWREDVKHRPGGRPLA